MGFFFVRQLKGRSKRLGPRRDFEVFLRCNKRRVRFFTLACGSEDQERSQVPIDFPEKALLRPAEAAIEYEECGRDAKRYSARFPPLRPSSTMIMVDFGRGQHPARAFSILDAIAPILLPLSKARSCCRHFRPTSGGAGMT